MDTATALHRAAPALDALLARRGLVAQADELLRRQCAPIADAIAERFAPAAPAREREASSARHLVVALAGAQGTGKSTIAALLDTLLRDGFGLRSVMLSLDDHYLSRAARQKLARDVHRLLATRGVPGTHDVAALATALQQLREAGDAETVELLQFSKADDDRSPQTRSVRGPFDVVLFEGWCVGARTQREAELREPQNQLERDEDPDGRFRGYVNHQLGGRYASLWSGLDMLVFLAAPSFEAVHDFRAQQERELRSSSARSKPGMMNEAQLTRFLQHYERITRHMLLTTPAEADVLIRLETDHRASAVIRREIRRRRPQ